MAGDKASALNARSVAGGPSFLLQALSWLLLVLGVAVSLQVARAGHDLAYLYVMGESIVGGFSIYDDAVIDTLPGRFGLERPPGMFYPPATGIAVAPLALVPFPVAKLIWIALVVASVLLGVRALVKLAQPDSPRTLWIGLSGVMLLAASTRWGMVLLQSAPLMLGLLCCFVALLHTGRMRLAIAIAVFATALKMTLAVPFLVLLVLHRQLVGAGLCVVSWLALNALGFVRMGSGAFVDYRRSMQALEASGAANVPDPWDLRGVPRLDWTFLYYGITTHLPFSRLAALASTGFVGLWLLWEIFRTKTPQSLERTTAFLAAAVCLGSLCVYHHEYDASLFLAPLLLGWLVMRRERPPTWILATILPLAATLLILPLGKTRDLLWNTLGATGVGLFKLSFPALMSAAMVGSLGLLVWQRRRAAPRPAP